MAIVPDNLRSAVTKSDRYEPTLNQAFENFASHYSTTILPARVYKPKDKAIVEGAVRIAYTRIYSVLDAKVFHTLQEMNDAIRVIMETYNDINLTDRPYGRREQFEDIERNALQPLPAFPFLFKRQQHVTVSVNGHVCLKEDKHYYSVLYLFIGKKVKLLYTSTQVEIYHNYTLLTVHERDRKQYGYTTNKEHLASTHKYLTDWNPERFINWAATIDKSVKVFIIGLMESKSHPEQAYKACQGVLGYERKVGRERLTNACKRSIEYGNYSYRSIKTILENKLDQEAYTELLTEIPQHENIRGENYYQ
jgi:hypothetical protein